MQQLGASALFAVIALFLIIGGLATALAEKSVNRPLEQKLTETRFPASAMPTDESIATPMDLGLVSPTSDSASPTISSTPTEEEIPTSVVCPAPTDWSSYIVQPGDTLNTLAQRYGIPAATLKTANCLLSDDLLPDTRLHVPPYPTATPIPCGPPYNWTAFYTVQRGDNLYRIGLKYRVSVQQLQQANCLGYSTQIKAGQRLYVPNVPTSTPVRTNTPTATSTALITATNTPTATATSTPDNTATLPPSMTASPPPATETFTPVPPSATATDIPTSNPTDTPLP